MRSETILEEFGEIGSRGGEEEENRWRCGRDEQEGWLRDAEELN